MGLFDLLKRKHEVETESETSIPEPREPEAGLTSLNAYAEAALPSASGLYPHEILMLHYAPAFHQKGNSFQKFWADQYGVCFPQAILEKLEAGGYIQPAGIRDTIAHLTTAKLKELLTGYGLPINGKKAELVERLSALEDLSQVEALYPDPYYVLTERGQSELRENAYVMYLHSHRNTIPLTIWEASKQIHQGGKTFPELLQDILRTEAESRVQSGDYDGVRNCCLTAWASLLDAEMEKKAFHALCATAWYDLNGLRNGSLQLVPAVREGFRNKLEELGGVQEEFRALLLQEFAALPVSERLMTDMQCADAVLADLAGDGERLAELLKEAGTLTGSGN